MKPLDTHPDAAPGAASPPAAPTDPVAAAVHPDPYPYYAQLLSGPPLAFDTGLGLWVAARAAVVSELLAHPDCRVRPGAEPVPKALQGSVAGAVFGDLIRMNDGERHRLPSIALRSVLAGIEPRRAYTLAARSSSESAPGLGESVALSRWLLEWPVGVVATLLGVGAAERPVVTAAVSAFVSGLSPGAGASARSGASTAASDLLALWTGLLHNADAAPHSPIARLKHEALALGWRDERAWAANLLGLLMQTHDASAGLLGNGLVALAREPAWRARLQREPGAALALVSEVLRLDPPVQNTRRFVARACRVAGVALAPGDTVLLVLAAAQRDPAAAGSAPSTSPSRTPTAAASLAFGTGHHACPGRALAAHIAAGALQALAQRPGADTHFDALRWRYRPSINARIPEFFTGDPAP